MNEPKILPEKSLGSNWILRNAHTECTGSTDKQTSSASTSSHKTWLRSSQPFPLRPTSHSRVVRISGSFPSHAKPKADNLCEAEDVKSSERVFPQARSV